MVKALFRVISARLEAVTDSPDREAEFIMQEVFGRDWRLKLLKGQLDRGPTPAERAAVNSMVERRLSGEPLQYILGEWEFYGLGFKVSPAVLIPRPDTEVLVDTALRLISGAESPKILDLCSGTGCVAIAIKRSRPDAEVTALELYPEAYAILIENIARHGGVTPAMADALDTETARRFHGLDLITANPPYLTADDMRSLQREVTHEPATALYGGGDGLDFYRGLSKIWMPAIKDGGHIAFEIGFTQERQVCEILEAGGYKDIACERDIEGRPRVVRARK